MVRVATQPQVATQPPFRARSRVLPAGKTVLPSPHTNPVVKKKTHCVHEVRSAGRPLTLSLHAVSGDSWEISDLDASDSLATLLERIAAVAGVAVGEQRLLLGDEADDLCRMVIHLFG